MNNEMKQRFIELLEQDAAQARKVAQAWKELEQIGARLEAQGNTVVAAADMVARSNEKEKELRAMIARIIALP